MGGFGTIGQDFLSYFSLYGAKNMKHGFQEKTLILFDKKILYYIHITQIQRWH
jgi:hypothetical protein